MTNGKIIDTNVLVKFLNGDKRALSVMTEIERPYITPVIIGELYYGANKSARRAENIALIEDLVSECSVLPIVKSTAQSYGIIKSNLVSKGMNIPENDLWIAASAHQNRMCVVSFDSHFSHIDEIDTAGQ